MELMALSEIIEFHYGQIGIWKLTEPASDLLNQYTLSEREKNEFAKINNEKRKKEYLAVRLLLKYMLKGNNTILYDDKGKPFLMDQILNISISHSDDLAVVMISQKNAGIDVESINRSIQKIASRVLNDKELADSSDEKDIRIKQLLYWCAKEAAYKFVSGENINFKTDIDIFPFKYEIPNGKFHGRYQKDRRWLNLNFKYFLHKNNIIVYCVT